MNGWAVEFEQGLVGQKEWWDIEGKYLQDDEPSPWEVHLWKVVEGCYGPWPHWKYQQWDNRPDEIPADKPPLRTVADWEVHLHKIEQKRIRDERRAELQKRRRFRTVEDRDCEDTRHIGLEARFGIDAPMTQEELDEYHNPTGMDIQHWIDTGGLQILHSDEQVDHSVQPEMTFPGGILEWLKTNNRIIYEFHDDGTPNMDLVRDDYGNLDWGDFGYSFNEGKHGKIHVYGRDTMRAWKYKDRKEGYLPPEAYRPQKNYKFHDENELPFEEPLYWEEYYPKEQALKAAREAAWLESSEGALSVDSDNFLSDVPDK